MRVQYSMRAGDEKLIFNEYWPKLCGCNTPYFGFTTQVFSLFQGREDILKVSLYAKNGVCVTSVSVVTS